MGGSEIIYMKHQHISDKSSFIYQFNLYYQQWDKNFVTKFSTQKIKYCESYDTKFQSRIGPKV